MGATDDIGNESRLTRLETEMGSLIGSEGRPGAIAELRKWIIISVILSALALGSRALDIGQVLLKQH